MSVTDGNELSTPPEEVKQFIIGLTSQGWRAFTREGDRIEGCAGKTFDGVVNAVWNRWPQAMLYAIVAPDLWGGDA